MAFYWGLSSVVRDMPALNLGAKWLLQCRYLQPPCAKSHLSDFQASNESSSLQLDLGWASGGKLRHRRGWVCLDATCVHGKVWGTQSCFSCVPRAVCSSTRLSLFYCSSTATRSNCYFTAEEKAARNEGFCPHLRPEADLAKCSWVLFWVAVLAFPSCVC